MNVLLWLTTPLRWLIEVILVGAHQALTTLGLDAGSGVAWVLSILVLVLVVRTALIPVLVRQIRGQRQLLQLAPHLQRIQERHQGRRDQASREAMSRETMALYRSAGTGPFASFLPLFVQVPVFFSLFETLNAAARTATGAATSLLLPGRLAGLGSAELFGAPLHATITASGGDPAVVVIGVVLIVVMVLTQFLTQRQILSRNATPETSSSPMHRQQRVLLYALPLVSVFSGVAFPLGVTIYWVLSNLWTTGQQLIVVHASPTPGSAAAKAREARLARRRRRRGRSGEPT